MKIFKKNCTFCDYSFLYNCQRTRNIYSPIEDVDIKVTQDIAQFSKNNYLDPRVKGKITIYSNANLDRDQVWNVYLRTIQEKWF
ncbi:MAG: hypothetical protein CM15mP108_3270 [Gammaproteobacteria bacterium]|nr:MAG: hypothetical protein CM15mP108_3270 [Gammaproteobacteria bacterium]